jgi:hypothetical protein
MQCMKDVYEQFAKMKCMKDVYKQFAKNEMYERCL